MNNAHEVEIRLAELIWRTFKLRASLLILSILVMLITWSALITGDRKAATVDDMFCGHLVDENNQIQNGLTAAENKYLKSKGTPTVQPIIFSAQDTCVAPISRTWIESTRYNDKTLGQLPGLPDEVKNIYSARPKEFQDYDADRRAAYRLEIQLSSTYSASSVEANSLSVAEAVPFCVFIALAAYFVLGFQQANYQAQLRVLHKADNGDKSDMPLKRAQAQFCTGTPRDPGSAFIESLVLSPERIATGTLLVGAVILLVAVVSAFILDLVHLTDSIFYSYPFALYASASVLSTLLVLTRRFYFTSKRAGRDLISPRLAEKQSTFARWLSVGLVAFGFLCLFFPWATDSGGGDSYKGYDFALSLYGEWVFSEIRIHIGVALIFLLVCGVHALFFWRARGKLGKMLLNGQRALAAGTLFLGINYLIYMAILEYESIIPTHWPMDLTDSSPMIEVNPSYGFWMFLTCCLVLVWLSLKTEVVEIFSPQAPVT